MFYDTDIVCFVTERSVWMGNFDGILLCTDLDGTLLKNDRTISRENLEAIAYFKENGGLFTFVTGRMPIFAADICRALDPNAPFGCVNGGGLFDYRAGRYVWHQALSRDVLPLIALVDENCPDVGIQINTFDDTYLYKDNPTMRIFEEVAGRSFPSPHYTAINEPFAKILFGSEDEAALLAARDLLLAHPLAENFDFIRSEKAFYEILPKGINKGTALREMVRHLPTPITKTVAVGDYDNDVAMLKAADCGVAVANACDAAKEAATFVTVSNEEHAIAHVIAGL